MRYIRGRGRIVRAQSIISLFTLCAVNSRARYIRGRGRIVRARSIDFTVCVMRGQFEGALYTRARSNSSRAVYNFTVYVMRGQFEGTLYSRARSNSSRAVY